MWKRGMLLLVARESGSGLSDGVNIEIKKGLTLKDKVRGPEVIADDSNKK